MYGRGTAAPRRYASTDFLLRSKSLVKNPDVA